MTKKQAVEYALAKIPNILPLEESEIRALCDQLLKSSNGNPDKIAEDILDILGHSELSFEFVIGFNDKLSTATDQQRPKIKPSVTAPTKVESSPKILNTKKPHTSENGRHQKEKTNQRSLLLREIGQISKFLEQEPDSKDRRKFTCNCQGNLHPLFEAAPNCLYCGKIICVREGLHLLECSSCGQDIISLEERLEILQILKQEKYELENGAAKPVEKQRQQVNKAKPSKSSFKISTGIGTNLFTEQDKLFELLERQKQRERKREQVLKDKEVTEKPDEKNEEISMDPDLVEAQERLDKLLYFQETSAERTKIIDNVSDFSMSNDSNLWGTTKERALMLKKQQRNLRKWEKMEHERNGRGKCVISMDIDSNGKITMSEARKNRETSVAHSDDETSDLSDEEDQKDLKIIHELKHDIESDKRKQASKLEDRIWDYKRDKNQFKKPIYISKDTKDVSKSTTRPPSSNSNIKSRVQVDESDEHFWDKLV